MKFASWGDVYFSGLSRGYDPGFAAWKADQWEKREAPKTPQGIGEDRMTECPPTPRIGGLKAHRSV